MKGNNYENLNCTLSILSGRFVAATNVTFRKLVTPSSSVNNCVKILSCTLLPALTVEVLRSAPSASISSMNIIEGATCFALLNKSLTALSDSPTHFENSSGPYKSVN